MSKKKVIAKEVPPEYQDFGFYFEDDFFNGEGDWRTTIVVRDGDERNFFNEEALDDVFFELEMFLAWQEAEESSLVYPLNNWHIDPSRKADVVKEINEIIKAWDEGKYRSRMSLAEDYLSIISGYRWETRDFFGYSQGDFCSVLYCTEFYSKEAVEEIGKFWLGCGSEFVIDGCHGYYVIDTVRWEEGEGLRNKLAELSGYPPEDLEIYLCTGSHVVHDYVKMEGEKSVS